MSDISPALLVVPVGKAYNSRYKQLFNTKNTSAFPLIYSSTDLIIYDGLDSSYSARTFVLYVC